MKRFFSFKTNLSMIQKICLAALFLSITTILQKVVAINYIPVVPFLRVSPGGPAMIIFSSILLGPWFGLLVGAGSDLIGYFVLDRSGFPLYPQITAIYALLGFASYFVFNFIRFVKNKKISFFLETLFLVASAIGVSLFLFLNESIKLYSSSYAFSLTQKIIITSVLSVLCLLILFISYLIDKKYKGTKIANAYQISLAASIIEVSVMVLFGTLMKGISFGFATYPAILVCQIMVLFFNVPLNTLLISILLKVTDKYFVMR